MNVSKSNICCKISDDIGISKKTSSQFLDKFIYLIKSKSKTQKVKISTFGTFYIKKTAKRVGRNPKTKESYIIESKNKLNFISSSLVKKFLNY